MKKHVNFSDTQGLTSTAKAQDLFFFPTRWHSDNCTGPRRPHSLTLCFWQQNHLVEFKNIVWLTTFDETQIAYPTFVAVGTRFDLSRYNWKEKGGTVEFMVNSCICWFDCFEKSNNSLDRRPTTSRRVFSPERTGGMKGYLQHEPTHFLSEATCSWLRIRHTRRRERRGGGRESRGRKTQALHDRRT